jgi:hypothetical protein
MAVIRIQDRRVALGPHTLLGRASRCAVRLSDRQVSSEHATLRWADGAWQLRDLGSRNGTFLDDARLEPAQARVVAVGSRIRLGTVVVATVLEAGPPGPAATEEGSEALVLAAGGLLALPDANEPRVVMYEEADGAWALELDGEPVALGEPPRVTIGDRAWALHLPASSRTEEVLPTLDGAATPRLENLALRFTPSADQEQVDAHLEWPGGALALSSRAHLFLMLELARARLADVAAGVRPSEAGWRYVDDLQRSLRLEPSVLCLHLFRAREQLTQAGVEGAGRLFERRRQSGQIRLAVEDVAVLD